MEATFEGLLRSVPAVLQTLPDDSKRSVAATSRSALAAVLEWTRATLRLSAGGDLLRSIAQRMRPGARPALGSVCVRWLAEATLAADEAGTFLAGLYAFVEQGSMSDEEDWADVRDWARSQYGSMDEEREAGGESEYEICDLLAVAQECAELGTPLKLRSVTAAQEDVHCGDRGGVLRKLLRLPSVASNLRRLKLQCFHLSSAEFTELMKVLRTTTKLEQLLMDGYYDGDIQISPAGMTELIDTVSGLEMLRELRLPPLPEASGALLRMLGTHKSLEELHLVVVQKGVIDEAALESMLRTSTTLRKLFIVDRSCTIDDSEEEDEWIGADVGKALSAGLSQNNALRELHVEGHYLTFNDGDVDSLLQNTTLQRLDLGRSIYGRFVSPLKLAAAVRRGSALRVIDVGSRLTDMVDVARALSSRSCVVELHAGDRWRLSEPALVPGFLRELAKAIADGALGRTLEALKIFDKSRQGRDTEGFVALAKALEHNHVLRDLEICHASFGDEEATALGTALQTNRALKTLTLQQCDIGDEGARGLAAGLQRNTTLQVADLWENKIGRAGATALADSLGAGSALERLRLGFHRPQTHRLTDQLACPVDDTVATSFARALRRGCALRVIGVGGCRVDSLPLRGMRELVDAMVERRQLGKHHEIGAALWGASKATPQQDIQEEVDGLKGRLRRTYEEGWGRIKLSISPRST
ncbi:unnamed protein product [Pedinophyceae sp. YPF-701]|nr:unnamed protein product [Pedinophyceae sp. YPF-701]